MTYDPGPTETKILIGVVVGILIVCALLAFGLLVGQRTTEADRSHRTARAEACRAIEDQALRTLCLVDRP